MKLKIFITFLLIYLFLFNQVIAGVLFSEIFPNTIDDANLEYIELYNSGSLEKSLSGYILKDKAGKEFIFGSGELIGSGQFKKFFRNKTKILLNNSNEELFLYDNSGSLLDNFNYTGTIKGEVITIINFGSGYLFESNSGSFENNSGSLEVNIGEGVTGTGNTNTGNTNTGSIESNSGFLEESGSGTDINSGEILKEFKLEFSFQNPSYILEKEKTMTGYICDNSNEFCKINIDLRNSFTGSFNENAYQCEIDFGFDGWLNGEENKCNPSTIIFPKGKYDLKFKIIEKNNILNIFTGGFLLENIIDPEIVEKEIIKEIEIEKIVTKIEKVYIEKIVYKEKDKIKEDINENENKKIEIKKPKIIIQSGLDENKKCKKEECSINLKYEELQKGEKCIWFFNKGIFSNGTEKKCNPGYVKYKLGNHEIKLKVYQSKNESNFKEALLKFTNIKKLKEEELILNNNKIFLKDEKEKKQINNENIIKEKILRINKKIKNDLLIKENINSSPKLLYSNEKNIKIKKISNEALLIGKRISDEIAIKKEIKPIIKIQGKIGKNKILKGNTLTCLDTCSINFDGGESVGDNLIYLWDFGNGEKFEGKNPGYIKYKIYGKYKVDLKILNNLGNEKIESFFVQFYPKIKKVNAEKEIKKVTEIKNKNIEKILDKKEIIEDGNNNIDKGISKTEILLYILIFVFSLNLIVIILRKEKLL